MQALYRMTLTETKLFLREPAAVFFTLAFPVMVLLLFSTIFGNEPIPNSGGLRSVDFMAPAYTGFIIGTVGLIGLPSTIAFYREKGILRRLRATPLNPVAMLGAHVLAQLLMMIVGAILLLSTAWLVFDLRLPETTIGVALGFVLASLSFFAIGFVIAGLLPSVRVATSVGQAIFFPMLFLSGAAIPREMLPETLKTVSAFIPLTYAVELIQDLWLDGSWNLTALAVLVGVLVASIIVSARTFRWE